MFIKLAVLCCLCVGVQAQQVVSKSYNNTISAKRLSVAAEKASIKITGWEKDYIAISMNFSAAHPDKKIALEELHYMQFMVIKDGDQMEVRNYFKLPATVNHIKSKLLVKIELLIPTGSKLQVTNRYGDVQLQNVSGDTKLDLTYGNLQLTDISGVITIHSVYTDLRGSGIATTSFKCTDETSTIALALEAGNYSFNSKHSSLHLALTNIQALTIGANRTDVTIHPQNLDACRYKVLNTAGQINLPEKYKSRIQKKGNQYSFITSGAVSFPLLAVDANYNSVTIK